MIDFKPLEVTPKQAFSKSHYYCDYIELLALLDCDDGVSQSDIYDRFYDDSVIEDICSGQLILATVLESWYLTSDSFGAKPAL